MKPKFHVEGVIFRYDPENDTIDKIKSIPEKDILIILTGSWKGEIYFSKPGSKVFLFVED
jgi:oxysterol-binding protein-related protein 9/10/11